VIEDCFIWFVCHMSWYRKCFSCSASIKTVYRTPSMSPTTRHANHMPHAQCVRIASAICTNCTPHFSFTPKCDFAFTLLERLVWISYIRPRTPRTLPSSVTLPLTANSPIPVCPPEPSFSQRCNRSLLSLGLML